MYVQHLGISDHVPISGPNADLVKGLWEEHEGRKRRSTTPPANPFPSEQALAKKRRDRASTFEMKAYPNATFGLRFEYSSGSL